MDFESFYNASSLITLTVKLLESKDFDSGRIKIIDFAGKINLSILIHTRRTINIHETNFNVTLARYKEKERERERERERQSKYVLRSRLKINPHA